jgi:glycosyltransferase involved in cell wall biosynthesis
MAVMASPPLRVAYVIDDLGHGGAQRQLTLLADALRGHAVIRVVVLSASVDPYADRLRAAGADVVALPRRSGLDLARLRALVLALRAFAPDVVHGVLDASNAYAFLAARRLGVPVVLSLRSDRLRVGGARARVLGAMLRRADAVVANSRAGTDCLVRAIGVAAARVHPLPNIVVVPTARAAPDRNMVGCAGRLVALKRFDMVIDALAVVRRSLPAARLSIFGDGPSRGELQARARPLGDAVILAGAVDDAASRIAGLGCLVVASEHEGLSNAALEAMAAGVPVAAVRAGDLPDLVADGVTGCIAASATPDAIAAAVVRALSDDGLRERAAREGPRIVAERFSAARAREAALAVYTGIANEWLWP